VKTITNLMMTVILKSVSQ